MVKTTNNLVPALFIALVAIVLVGIGVYAAVSTNSNQRTTTVATPAPSPSMAVAAAQPFPLDDPKATYTMLKKLPDNKDFTVVYTPDGGTAIYADAEAKSGINLDEYLGKPVVIKGSFSDKQKNVQCVKAPCPPASQTVLTIDRISYKK